jgi:hypothetical protein
MDECRDGNKKGGAQNHSFTYDEKIKVENVESVTQAVCYLG